MDGLSLSAVVYELKVLLGGRIEKVQQPERDELLISVHSAGGSYRLLISASPENCRVLLTDEKKTSPVDAPAFLMLMRKHLTGARIAGVDQPNLDRIVEFELDSVSELHDPVKLRLVCEIMGRHSNIILVDEGGAIVDSIVHVTPSLSSARLVMPKLPYEKPPSKVKLDPRNADADAFEAAIGAKPESTLADSFYGLSPAVAKRLIASLGYPDIDKRQLAERLVKFYRDFANGIFSPCIVMAGSKPLCTLPFLPKDGSEYKPFCAMSDAISAFYSSRASEESIKRRTSSYEHILKNCSAKLEKKLSIYTDAILSESEYEKNRLYGELLTANLYSVPSRADRAVVQNYYSDPPEPLEIPLDPKLSAAENANRYFIKYRKAKLAREHALVMQEQVSNELSYVDELLYTLSCCDNESELNEIRREMIASGYLREAPVKKNRNGKIAEKNKLPPSKPLCFTSRDGIHILVGKNNRQNDSLTLSTAAPEDTWLHVKDIHGSHVIIKCGSNIPDSTLYDAAVLAAYYSKARGSANVPVDHTLVKYVKKPSGAKPGMVIYTHQRTVYVTPDADHVKLLLENGDKSK